VTDPVSTSGNLDESVPIITALSVEGFKSIDSEQSIEIRPLTILAGANSSGKSSMLQPLLLLKQTLEAAFDPGPLLLNGPHVKFTKLDQLISARTREKKEVQVGFGIHFEGENFFKVIFSQNENRELAVSSNELRLENGHRVLVNGNPVDFSNYYNGIDANLEIYRKEEYKIGVMRKFVLGPTLDQRISKTTMEFHEFNTKSIENSIVNAIHVPGLRGVPSRTYPMAAVNGRFPGTFEPYIASIIASWKTKNLTAISQLASDLKEMELTSGVEAVRLDDSQIEIKVPRLLESNPGNNQDWVSIADVGFGVSQTLPVAVALLAASPGQLVYIEQPELHLHPRAQHAMAGLLARAAKRGVRVVIETHSSILLLGIQNLVARERLDPELVKLHWFQRDSNTGSTRISSADLDHSGAFGEWPEDFDDVSLQAQREYLDAVESHLAS